MNITTGVTCVSLCITTVVMINRLYVTSRIYTGVMNNQSIKFISSVWWLDIYLFDLVFIGVF